MRTDPGHAGVATWSAESVTPSISANSALVNGQANVYDWIVQLNTHDLGGITQLAQTTSLLAGAGIDFQVIRGPDQKGRQRFSRSIGSSFNTVEQWFSHDTYVSTYEQDALRQDDAISNDPVALATLGHDENRRPGRLEHHHRGNPR